MISKNRIEILKATRPFIKGIQVFNSFFLILDLPAL
jgi:hypothetical protein